MCFAIIANTAKGCLLLISIEEQDLRCRLLAKCCLENKSLADVVIRSSSCRNTQYIVVLFCVAFAVRKF